MDIENSFRLINMHIRDGTMEMVRPEIDRIVEATDDPFTLIKCASLLKVVDDEEGCRSITDKVLEHVPEDVGQRFGVAQALRGLGRVEQAYSIFRQMDEDDSVLREEALCLQEMGESEEALVKIRRILVNDSHNAEIEISALCSVGEFKEALAQAEAYVAGGKNYDSMSVLCTVLLQMGNVKEAVKAAKAYMKEDKGADPFALASYVMRICGKSAAAANYANRALNIDHTHKGALENMAMCLVEKGKINEAKVLAGAINHADPGCEEVIRILDACRQASS
jgi:tetratricopeptide (TPR) repeat protein